MHGGTARRHPRRPKVIAALLWLCRRRLHRRASPGETAPWSELPPELLGLVFSRLPSQADLVRVRAVCRPWRSAARLQPLAPPLPCLVLRDNTMLTLPDGTPHRTLHRLPVDWNYIDFRISTGGMLFLKDRFCRCYLLDPFSRSRETNPLRINHYVPNNDQHYPLKVVVYHHTVAVLHKGKVHFFPRGVRSYSTMVWAPPGNTHLAVDIALFQGKLYVLTAKYMEDDPELPELHLLDICFLNVSYEQTHVRSVQCIEGMPRNCVDPGLPANQRQWSFFYLVVSGDRLLMVERQTDVEIPFTVGSSRPIRTQFEVSEWVDLIGCHGRWSKVDTLMGRTLFISQDCSRSLPAQSGAREDCIYFGSKWMLNPQGDTLDCVVYNVKDKTMEPLTSEMRAAMKVGTRGRWQPTWLFPADVNLSDIYKFKV